MKDYARNGKVNLNENTYSLVLSYNDNRTTFTICNISPSTEIYIVFCDGTTTVKPSGVCIKRSTCMTFPSNGIPAYHGKVCAISDTGNAVLTFLEY